MIGIMTTWHFDESDFDDGDDDDKHDDFDRFLTLVMITCHSKGSGSSGFESDPDSAEIREIIR